MKINIIGNRDIAGFVEVKEQDTLKSIYRSLGQMKSPKIIQVGGALGTFYKDYDINKTIESLQADFKEPYIGYFDTFCPVDYSRFMIRFVMRELNIVNDSLHQLNDLMVKITEDKASELDFKMINLLLSSDVQTLGEKLLYKNISQLIQWFEEEFIEHLEGQCRLGICRGLIDAQCINACPAHIHIPGFVALMKDELYEDAYKLMRKENPLSGVCGSICARPCEDRCRRGEITGTVGVRALQRFITSEALEHWRYNDKCLEDNSKHIAIIGGGPSGLTAAYYLKRTGYQVTIYEKHSEAGGMLSFGVPKYRLPQNAIRQEIETIEKLGIKILTNTEVGKDIMFETIKDKHDAVLLATGTPIGRKVEVDHQHVMSGIDFLKSVHLDTDMTYGKNILVVGGGDVAMDCARTAIRLDSRVTLMSLESYDLMPASLEEKIQANEEGVIIKTGYAIDTVSGQDISLKRCIEVLDDGGKFSPIYEACDEKLDGVDMIVYAIGQVKDLSFLPDSPNQLTYDLGDKVFACGDVIKATIVIDAIAQGKKVAEKIDISLGGQGLYLGDDIHLPEKVLNIRTFDYDLREIDTLNPDKRIKSFDQVNQNYTIEDAVYEADRCMRCDRNSKASLLLGR